MNRLPYDIIDDIMQYLDVDSSRNLLLSSKNIHDLYRHNKHYEIIMIKKFFSYFSSLAKLKIEYKNLPYDNIGEIYNTLNKLYNYFKKHQHACLSDFLIYLCDNNMSNSYVFELLISYCYFSKTGEYIYNAIRADDLMYILTFTKDVQKITTYIYVDAVIIMHVIKYKISIKDRKNTSYLLKYLLFKHFFRYSEYVEDIISEIVCELIKYNDLVLITELYNKQKMYKFKLNYQMIITSCIQQKNTECLELVHSKMIEQNDLLINSGRIPQRVMITKESIRYLMKNKGYVMLHKIIELYLKDIININGYVQEIIYNFDYKNKECLKLLDYLNNKNRNMIINKMTR
jgi:hypothetical protein